MKHQIPTQLWGNARETRDAHKASNAKFARIQQRIADLTACDIEEAEDVVMMPAPMKAKMKVVKAPKKPAKVKSFASLKSLF